MLSSLVLLYLTSGPRLAWPWSPTAHDSEAGGASLWGVLHQSQRAPSPGLRLVGGLVGGRLSPLARLSATFGLKGLALSWADPVCLGVCCVYVHLAPRAFYITLYILFPLHSSPAGTRLTARCSFCLVSWNALTLGCSRAVYFVLFLPHPRQALDSTGG